MRQWLAGGRNYLLIYLVIINLTAFAAMFADKQKARAHAWRIPEKTLFALALLGGSVGGLAGMYLFRHKTRHLKFVIGFPAILLLQISAAALLWRIL